MVFSNGDGGADMMHGVMLDMRHRGPLVDNKQAMQVKQANLTIQHDRDACRFHACAAAA
jgi:hypothetical protein